MYSPKLRSDQTEDIRRLSSEVKKPMTILVREAVDIYLKKRGYGIYCRLARKTTQKAN